MSLFNVVFESKLPCFVDWLICDSASHPTIMVSTGRCLYFKFFYPLLGCHDAQNAIEIIITQEKK